jgi:predicted phosphodiesterase
MGDLSIQGILFLGDQYHTHSLIHLEVQDFWQKAFEFLREPLNNTVCLVGNHDMSGVKGSSMNAMGIHGNAIMAPTVKDGVLFVPYCHDPQEFVKVCQNNPTKVVVCHQEFNGADLGGMYSKEGVNPKDIPQSVVVSGHIHTKQTFDKVIYPGSPRWRTLSDANQPKSILLMDLDTGDVLKEYPTDVVCKKIVLIDHLESDPPKEYQLPPNTDVTVRLYGSVKFCELQSVAWKSKGCKVKTYPDQVTVAKIKESDGLSESFSKYFKVFEPPKKSQKEALWNLAKARIHWI